MANVPPFPLYSSPLQLTEKQQPLPGFPISKDLLNWIMSSLVPQVESTSTVLTPVELTGQSASIPVTALPLPTLAAGLYRITSYARVTVPDAASSSLIVTLLWTEDGLTVSHSFPAMTGNTVQTSDSEVLLIQNDQDSPISYATTYASGTSGAMKYRLNLVTEAL